MRENKDGNVASRHSITIMRVSSDTSDRSRTEAGLSAAVSDGSCRVPRSFEKTRSPRRPARDSGTSSRPRRVSVSCLRCFTCLPGDVWPSLGAVSPSLASRRENRTRLRRDALIRGRRSQYRDTRSPPTTGNSKKPSDRIWQLSYLKSL